MCFLFWSFCSYFFLIMQAMPEGKLNLLSRNTFVFWFCIFVLYFLSRQAFSCSYSWLYQSNGGECFYETALHLLSQVSFAFESHISVNLCAAAMNNCCDDLEALSWLLKLLKPDDLVAQIPLLLPPFFLFATILSALYPRFWTKNWSELKLLATTWIELRWIDAKCESFARVTFDVGRPVDPHQFQISCQQLEEKFWQNLGPVQRGGEKVGGKWWKKATRCVPSR